MYQFATTTTGPQPGLIQALGIDWKLLLIQAVAFLVLVWLLGKFVYPTLIKSIDSRREQIEAGLTEAKQSREALEVASKQAAELLAQARHDADAVIDRSQQEAITLLADSEAKAKVRAQQLVADAHKQLETDISKARQTLKHDTAQLVATATEQIIHEKLDVKKDAQLIEKSLRDIK